MSVGWRHKMAIPCTRRVKLSAR